MLKIKLNPDEEEVREIKRAIKENNGHCPCTLRRDKTTKCMCKEFREQNEPGYCHCGLYYKEEVEEC